MAARLPNIAVQIPFWLKKKAERVHVVDSGTTGPKNLSFVTHFSQTAPRLVCKLQWNANVIVDLAWLHAPSLACLERHSHVWNHIRRLCQPKCCLSCSPFMSSKSFNGLLCLALIMSFYDETNTGGYEVEWILKCTTYWHSKWKREFPGVCLAAQPWYIWLQHAFNARLTCFRNIAGCIMSVIELLMSSSTLSCLILSLVV